MVGGLEPGGGNLSGLVLADLVTGQTGDLGMGRGIFSLLSLPARMVASHGAGSEFPTPDGSVNVPHQKKTMLIQRVQLKEILEF